MNYPSVCPSVRPSVLVFGALVVWPTGSQFYLVQLFYNWLYLISSMLSYNFQLFYDLYEYKGIFLVSPCHQNVEFQPGNGQKRKIGVFFGSRINKIQLLMIICIVNYRNKSSEEFFECFRNALYLALQILSSHHWTRIEFSLSLGLFIP